MSEKEKFGEIGGYWLTKRRNSPNWCRTWYDRDKRQTRRASLGEADPERAKLALSKWVLENAIPEQRASKDVPLAEVFARYWLNRGRHVPSKKAQRANLDILNEHIGHLMTAEFNEARQAEVVEMLRRKYADSTIQRIFATGFAAMNFAERREIIDKAPKKSVDLEPGPEREYVASIEELARFWDAPKPEHIDRLFLMMLGTLSRPGAILDLTRFQCDLEQGLINLNPSGRKQTKKRRPIVPMCDVTRAVIESTIGDHIVSYRGRRITWLSKIWRQVREDAGLPDAFIPYALRHTGATELSKRGVPIEDVSSILGHRMPEFRSTLRYVKYQPNYQQRAVSALNDLFTELAQASRRGLDDFIRPTSVRVGMRDQAEIGLVIGAGDALLWFL